MRTMTESFTKSFELHAERETKRKIKKVGMASNETKILRFLVSQSPEAENGPAVSFDNLTEQEKEIETKIKNILLDLKEGAACYVDDDTGLDFLPSEEIDVDDVEVAFEDLDVSTGRRKSFTTYKYAKNVLDWREEQRRKSANKAYPSFKALQHRWRLAKDPSYLSRFQNYVNKVGSNREKFRLNSTFVMRKFLDARRDGLQIHDRHLQSWALEKASRLMMSSANFKASHSWVQIFKKKERHYLTEDHQVFDDSLTKNIKDVQVAAVEFQPMIKDDILREFRKEEVFNVDQSAMVYEQHSARTLSF